MKKSSNRFSKKLIRHTKWRFEMRKFSIILMFLVMISSTGLQLYTQELSAVDIVKKSDEVANAPKDQHSFSRMILIDKKGNKKIRKTEMYQKGDETRLVRFQSPADQKGISFLSLPDDVMYLYLPAFRKIRRIASHVKNQNFAGTDFSYDDMSSFNYAKEYDAKLLKETEKVYILELTPKANIKKDYSKLKFWVLKSNFYPSKIEHFDKAGNLWKIMDRRKIEKKGNYWVAMEMEMQDLKKNHKTRMIIDKIEYDSGLSEKVFTKRNLKRVR